MITIFQLIFLFIKTEIKNLFNSFYKKRKFNQYLSENKYDFFTKFSYKIKTTQKILITSFLSINDYLKYEYLLGVYLSNIKKKNIKVLIEENDLASKNFFLKHGIKDFVFFKSFPSFVARLNYFIKSYFLLSKIKNIEDLVKFKYQGISAGKVIYSELARFTRTPTFNRIETRFYSTFAKYLYFSDIFKNIISKEKFKYFIQSEPQFIPATIFMACALKKKLFMISRIGNNKLISVRLVNNLDAFSENRSKFDKRLFYQIKKKHKKKAIQIGKNIIIDRFLGKNIPNRDIDKEAIKLNKFNKIKFIENYNKHDICKIFNWEFSKPIGVIMANDLTDGLFTHTGQIFRDNWVWLIEVLKLASKNEKINWFVKAHPTDIKNEKKMRTKYLLEKHKYPVNIQFFPDHWGRVNLYKFVDIVFTNFGSAGYEYSAMGIPSVITSHAAYHGLKIAYEARNLNDLNKIIMKSHEIKKLSKDRVDNACIFVFLENVYTKVNLELATMNNLDPYEHNNYWKEYEKNYKFSNIYKNKSLKNDQFYKSFKNQVNKKLKHIVNFSYI